MKKLFVFVLISLNLSGCGPTLFTVGAMNVTAGDVVSSAVKYKVLEDE